MAINKVLWGDREFLSGFGKQFMYSFATDLRDSKKIKLDMSSYTKDELIDFIVENL